MLSDLKEGKYPPLILAPVSSESFGSGASVMAESGVRPAPLYVLAPSTGGTRLPAGTICGAEDLGCAGGKGGVGGCGAGSKWGDSVPSSACWTAGPLNGVSKTGEVGCCPSNASAARRFEVVFERVLLNRVGELRDLKRLVKQLVRQLPGIVKNGRI